MEDNLPHGTDENTAFIQRCGNLREASRCYPITYAERDKIMKTFTALMAASALAFSGAAATGIVAPAPAKADPPSWAPAHGKRAKERARSQARVYDSRGRYVQPRRIGRDDRVWRGDGGQYYCRRDNGTTGLVIGAGVGALAGSEIAGRGDRTLGAILGGVAGGLLGRELDRGSLQCR